MLKLEQYVRIREWYVYVWFHARAKDRVNTRNARILIYYCMLIFRIDRIKSFQVSSKEDER